MIQTTDPRFAILDLPPYPPLPGTLESNKVDEVRCTVYVKNLELTVTAEQILQFFSQVTRHSNRIVVYRHFVTKADILFLSEGVDRIS